MFLGICLAVVFVLAMTIWAFIKAREFAFMAFIFSVIAGIAFFGISNSIELNNPSYFQSPYVAVVGNNILSPHVFFKDYSIANSDTLIIPSHYYLKHDWINTWMYCDESMSIVYPDSMASGHVYHREAPSPYVSEGSVECK